jgi:hypothetical protein
VHGADVVQLFLGGEAARGLAGEATGRIVGASGEAALAPGVVAVALHHGAGLVGDDGDRAEIVGVEVAGGDGAAGQDAHAEQGAAGADIVVPLRAARTEQLGMDAEGIELERVALRRLLHEALVVDIVGEEQRARALGDRDRLVVGGVADAAAEAGGVIRNSRLSAVSP